MCCGAVGFRGWIKHDDHLRETGFLAGEAIADTMLFTSALKYGTDRVRPKATGLSAESGEFWPDGTHQELDLPARVFTSYYVREGECHGAVP